MTTEAIQARLNTGDGPSFAQALRAAALYESEDDLRETLEVAVRCADQAENFWAIAEAVIIAMQARRVVPANAMRIIGSLPENEMTIGSIKEAKTLLEKWPGSMI